MTCSVFATHLARFVSLDGIEVDTAERVNAAPEPWLPDAALIGDLRHRLAPVYDACSARFGDQLPASWRV